MAFEPCNKHATEFPVSQVFNEHPVNQAGAEFLCSGTVGVFRDFGNASFEYGSLSSFPRANFPEIVLGGDIGIKFREVPGGTRVLWDFSNFKEFLEDTGTNRGDK